MNAQPKREINLVQAITYPFKRSHWVSVTLLPGAVLTILVLLTDSVYGQILPEKNVVAVGIICLCVALAIPLGYAWRLIHIFRTSGYDAAAPDWTAEQAMADLFCGLKLTFLATAVVAVFMLPDSLSAFNPPTATPAPAPAPKSIPVKTGYQALDAWVTGLANDCLLDDPAKPPKQMPKA